MLVGSTILPRSTTVSVDFYIFHSKKTTLFTKYDVLSLLVIWSILSSGVFDQFIFSPPALYLTCIIFSKLSVSAFKAYLPF